MGWVTVFAYFVGAYLCAKTYRVAPLDRGFWFGLAILLVCLGINKQLDLQSLLTAGGRCLAKAQGWYESRRLVQIVVISGLVVSVLVVFLVTLGVMWDAMGRIALALIGVAFLVAFVAIRAVGFHHMDIFIGSTIAGVRMNWVLELTGIVCIIINAQRRISRAGRDRRLARETTAQDY